MIAGRMRPRGIDGRALLVATTLTASLMGLGTLSPPAGASPGSAAGFSQCLAFAPVDSLVDFCLYARGTSGVIELGRQTVPVTSAFTLQGGFIRNEETETETFTAALDGETLSKAPQGIPGGLQGIVSSTLLPRPLRESYEKVIDKGITGVTGTPILAKPPSSIGIDTSDIVNEEGDGLSLPVKIHLENPFLGSDCYIGSSSNPISWNLTTGETAPPAPNHPIEGKLGDLEGENEGGFDFDEISNDIEVDNSFSVPGASGCGGSFSSVVDPLIDAKIGLPSPVGHNSVELGLTIKLMAAENVLRLSSQAKGTTRAPSVQGLAEIKPPARSGR